MDPVTGITLASQLIGMGIQGVGALGAANYSSQENDIQKQILGQEQATNEVRRQAMHISAQRQSIETIRRTQKARAMGIAAGVNQGAQFGSGVAGGAAGAAAAGGFGLLGINQNRQLGDQIFDIDSRIGSLKMQLGDVMTDQSNYQGMMGLGLGLVQGGPAIGRVGASLIGSGSGGLGGPKGNDVGY